VNITTVNGTAPLNFSPKSGVAVSTHGNAENFVWSIQKSLNNGTTWVAMKDALGATSFTGSGDFVLTPVGTALYRVIVTSLGTATSVLVSTN
jgi:hypothetical protein